MASALKQELKVWEAAFRAEHGRDPTKQDIKQEPEIAQRYKAYAQSKQAPPRGNPKNRETPSKHNNSSAQPRQRPPGRDALEENPFVTSATTTTRVGRPSESHPKRPRFVLANSPSKIRALATMHSSSGSPNRPSGANWISTDEHTSTTLSATASSSSRHGAECRTKSSSGVSTSLNRTPADYNRSPRKVTNPFQSPGKRETVTIQPPSRGTTLFGDFERSEQDRLSLRKRQRESVEVKDGMGWGHARKVIGTSGPKGHIEPDKDIDMDTGSSFGGIGERPDPTDRRASSVASHHDPTLSPLSDQDRDDELLGPSPVKSFGLGRASSFGFDHAKPFKPLFDDPLPSVSVTSQGHPLPSTSEKPRLFESSLKSVSSLSADCLTLRGTKRTALTSSGAVSGGARHGMEKIEVRAGMDDPPDLAEDDFYADRVSALAGTDGRADGNGKGKKKRVSSASARRAKPRVKGTGQAFEIEHEENSAADTVMADDELKVERGAGGELVLDFRVEVTGTGREGELQETRERVMIHQQGRQSARKDDSDSDTFAPEAYLLGQTRRTHQSSQTHARAPSGHTSLPSNLASILSLRSASPQKSAAAAKDRQVAKLLGEPTAAARERRRRGLLELEDEGLVARVVQDSLGDGSEAEGRSEDDDWDEEVDGWKQPGDAMDGYYSGTDGW
ncbi:hypothetical protein JCM16303_005280 [Sporobolomyces ruberrimus]